MLARHRQAEVERFAVDREVAGVEIRAQVGGVEVAQQVHQRGGVEAHAVVGVGVVADLDVVNAGQLLPRGKGPAHVVHLLPVVHRLRLEPEIAQLEQPHVGAVHRRQQRLCQGMVGREQIEVARNHANLQAGLLHLRLGLCPG